MSHPGSSRTATIKQLRAFLTVARSGSFTRAAGELHMSQPALTMAIQQLEDVVGIGLFDRTTRVVTLTEEGTDFVHTAERLITDFDVAMQDIHATAARRRGFLGIATIYSLAQKILPRAIRAMAKGHLVVRTSIWEGNSAEVRRRVQRNEVDMGFGSKGETSNDLEFIPLFRDLMGVVARADNPLCTHRRDPKWDDLKGLEFVGVTGDTATYQMFRDMSRLPDSVTKPRYQVSDTGMLLSMVEADNGVGAVPALAAPDRKSGTLMFRRLSTPEIWREVYVIKRRGRSLTPEALELIDHMRGDLGRIAAHNPAIRLSKP